jgi:hypothetical protein
MVVAPSAAASQPINTGYPDVDASTVHTGFGLVPKKGGKLRRPKKGTETWFKLCMSAIWIIDEYSMVSQEMLSELDALGREASFASTVLPFGGRTVVCFGDPCQLPPVNARPVYCWGFWRARFRFVELVHK